MLLASQSPFGNATVTICHSRTPDLGAVTRQADFLVPAIGKPRLVTREMVKPGAVIVDVGMGSGSAQVNIDTGDGNDVVGSSWVSASFFGGHSQTNIATGAGNDTIAAGVLTASFFGGSSQTNIDTGSGEDTISVGLLGLQVGHASRLELMTISKSPQPGGGAGRASSPAR